jgi:FtsZ-interacting cell division protein ZipA
VVSQFGVDRQRTRLGSRYGWIELRREGMSTGLIVVVVVVAVLLVAALGFALSRSRARAQVRARQRELDRRRDHAADGHRQAAQDRDQRAAEAGRRARMAALEAEREEAEAALENEHASLHERGLADHELVADHEREHFAGTSAVQDRADQTYAGDADDGVAADRGGNGERPAVGGETNSAELERERERGT